MLNTIIDKNKNSSIFSHGLLFSQSDDRDEKKTTKSKIKEKESREKKYIEL